MDFLRVNFQLATPFRFRPRVKYVTDRRTDRQRPSMRYAPTSWGLDIIKIAYGKILGHIAQALILYCRFSE